MIALEHVAQDEIEYLARLYKTREWCRRAARATRVHGMHESADNFASVAAMCTRLMKNTKRSWNEAILNEMIA